MEEKSDLSLIDAIRELRNHDPFEPFRLVTTSGDKYLIESPDNLAIGESQMFYYYPGSDKFVFIRLNQLVAVEHFEKRPAA
jgi:hypothetical protein